MSLLRKIQDDAIDSSVDLPSLLRKCKVLAARLGSPEFKQWLEYELEGYPSRDVLPDYRIQHVQSKGDFSGPFGSGLRNADIPLSCIDKSFHSNLRRSYRMEPVAALEALLQSSGDGPFQEPWNPDLVAYAGRRIYQDMNCMQAWKVIPRGSIVAALDTVRTRVLNFVLEIEAQNPDAGEAALNSNPVPQEKVQQIFNTIVTGSVQNLATGNADVRQTADYVQAADVKLFEALLAALANAPLPPGTAAPISEAVEAMRSTQGTSGFRQHYQKFMSLLADHMQVLGPIVAPFLKGLAGM